MPLLSPPLAASLAPPAPDALNKLLGFLKTGGVGGKELLETRLFCPHENRANSVRLSFADLPPASLWARQIK